MSKNSKIEWCDATWNPIRAWLKSEMLDVPPTRWGYHCERISPGCVHCYASTMNGRMLPTWGTGLDYTVPNREKVEIFLDEKELRKPLHWHKPRSVFPCSMTDWCATFVTDEMRDRMIAVAALCPQHRFLFLTKRADECEEYFHRSANPHRSLPVLSRVTFWTDQMSSGIEVFEWPLPNFWLGFSAENQECFDARWEHMRKLAAAGWNVWCSAEPLLAGIDMSAALSEGLRWVVVGGESGHGARPMNAQWVRDIIGQCCNAGAGVPVFVKQLGAKPVRYMGINGALELEAFAGTPIDTTYPMRLQDRKGGDMAEWPEDLRVREVPR